MNKNKSIKIISTGVAILAGLGILFWLGRSNVNNLGRNSSDLNASFGSYLVGDENYYDFGTISMAAGKVAHSFRIKNSGAEPLIIEKMYTSCMCTTASLIKGGKRFGPYGMPGHGFISPINASFVPQEEATVEVVFDPAAHGPAGIGPVERMVYLEGKEGNLATLIIKAEVTP